MIALHMLTFESRNDHAHYRIGCNSFRLSRDNHQFHYIPDRDGPDDYGRLFEPRPFPEDYHQDTIRDDETYLALEGALTMSTGRNTRLMYDNCSVYALNAPHIASGLSLRHYTHFLKRKYGGMVDVDARVGGPVLGPEFR